MRHENWYTEDESGTIDDFDVELEDLPLEETSSPGSRLFATGIAFLRHVHQMKVAFTPPAEDDIDEDDECEFDIRMTYIPQEDLPRPIPARHESKTKAQKRHLRTIFFPTLLLALLILFTNTVTPIHDRLAMLLSTATLTPQTGQHSLSSYGGHIIDNPPNGVVYDNKTQVLQVTMNGKERYLLIPASVPYECPTGVTPGQQGQIGNFPVWLDGFGAPNTVLHLPSTFVSNPRNWPGWVVNFRVNVRLRYSSIVILTIDDLNHASSPLLRNPTDSTHQPRIVLNPVTPQHVVDVAGQHAIGSWDMSIYLPGAGCYSLNASWNEGSWEMIFAAGK